jgi:NhaP-type Na+/H+ and K+/H+ antiporter
MGAFSKGKGFLAPCLVCVCIVFFSDIAVRFQLLSATRGRLWKLQITKVDRFLFLGLFNRPFQLHMLCMTQRYDGVDDKLERM